MRYFRPKSSAWWSGVGLIVLGVAQISCRDCNLSEASQILTGLLGGTDSSPVGTILFGFGIIGIRDKLSRLNDG